MDDRRNEHKIMLHSKIPPACDNNGDDEIIITYFINPHMFYYKYQSSLYNNRDFNEFENAIQNYYSSQSKLEAISSFAHESYPSMKVQPKIGQIYAVLNCSAKKWIRGKLDDICEYSVSKPQYIFWALDYGVPLITKLKWIRELPDHLSEVDTKMIFLGGIHGVIPAEPEFDFMENCTKLKLSKDWSKKSVTTIKNIIDNAASTKFVVKEYSLDTQHYFGALEVCTHTNQKIKCDQVLVEITSATRIDNGSFMEAIKTLRTSKITRWKTNEGTTNVFKFYQNKNHLQDWNFHQPICAKTTNHGNFAANLIDPFIQEKVEDWERRNNNEGTQFPHKITIDDISFNDSVSVAAAIDCPSRGLDDNPLLLRESLIIRKRKTLKEKLSIKLKDREQKLSNELLNKDETNENNKSSESSKSEIIGDNCVLYDNASENISVKSAEMKEMQMESFSNKSESDKMTSKESQTSNSLNVKDKFEENYREPGTDDLNFKGHSNVVSNKPDQKLERTRCFIPAGIDLRNLKISSIKNDVRRKKNSTSSHSLNESVNGTIPDIIPSKRDSEILVDKTIFSKIQNKKEKQKNLLANVDEVCLPSNLIKHLVLIHGKHIISEPVGNIRDANFSDEIHRELELRGLTKIFRIQSYAWPHLMQQNSLVLVHGPKTGKTMSYLPAICSLIRMEVEDCLVPETVGPIAIIIVPSSVDVERISRMCRSFLQSNNERKFSIAECYGIRTLAKVEEQLLSCCDVLVATIPSLCRVLDEDLKLVDLKRLRHLIIDNIELTNDDFKKDLSFILKKCYPIKRRNNKNETQLVIASCSWDPILHEFLDNCKNPLLCIGAYMDAAVYAHSNITLKLLDSQLKAQCFLDFLKECPYESEYTLIVCNNQADICAISNALKTNSCNFIAVSLTSSMHEIELAKMWCYKEEGERPILVCTDDILPELKIDNVQHLINYSLPRTWSAFTFRFSTQFSYYPDLIKNKVSEKPPASALIFLDENNNEQLPQLINFLVKRNCSNIPEEIINLSNRIKIQREEERISTLREKCPLFLELGRCPNEIKCKFRHVLTKYDKAEDSLPSEGIIKISILEVISPVHYYVRLLEHKSQNFSWREINDSKNYAKFFLEFSKYFTNVDNCEIYWPIQLNDLCVVLYKNNYYRCLILDYDEPKRGHNDIKFKCTVRLIDTGKIITIDYKKASLLTLPDQFRNFPQQAIDLRLLGIMPYDHDIKWDSHATENVKSWIKKSMQENKMIVKASINFSLKGTIWVDNIVLEEQLTAIKHSIIGINIKKSLIEKNFAIPSDTTKNILKGLAAECDLLNKDVQKDLNEFSKSMKIEHNEETFSKNVDSSSSISPNTSSANSFLSANYTVVNEGSGKKSSNASSSLSATDRNHYSGSNDQSNSTDNTFHSFSNSNLESGEKNTNNGTQPDVWEQLPKIEFTRIFITTFYSPDNFYVQNIENCERLESLYNKIDEFILNKKIPIKDAKIGQNCLVMHDGNYNRAKIISVLAEADGSKAKVFLCDIGDSDEILLNDIIESSEEIIKYIPFQAIQCKMVGIYSTYNGFWTEEICDKIYDEILQQCDYLYAKPVLKKETIDSVLNSYKYEVRLVDCTTEEDLQINKEIIERGLATYNPETKHLLEVTSFSEEEKYPENFLDNKEIAEDSVNNKNYSSDSSECSFDIQNKEIAVDSVDKKNYSNDSSECSFDIQFSREELLKWITQNSNQFLPEQNDDFPNESVKKENSFENKVIENNGTNLDEAQERAEEISSNSNEDSNEYLGMLPLKCPYKIPEVSWWQTKHIIYLSVAVPDVKDYSLKITSENLIFTANTEQDLYVLVLNFFGSIDPKLVSHKIRGLTVSIHLLKTQTRFLWPQLLCQSDKYFWLKKNLNAIIKDDEDLIQNQYSRHVTNYLSPKVRNFSSDESDDSNDDDNDLDF